MKVPHPRLSFDRLGIKANRLLLPIDLAKCPLEIFPVANGLTQPFHGEIVLLHVLDQRKNRVPQDGGEMALLRAERHLERIGADLLSPTVEASFRVRIGIPYYEIRAAAAGKNVDLILLPTFVPALWRRWAGFAYGETVRNLVVDAPCRVFVVEVRTRLNCFRRWAKDGSFGRCAAA
ncbi:MAG TPA: universal stress protein [Opitutaceae bacterium]|nr:universal stress protein [Opitutaceae bacterium]